MSNLQIVEPTAPVTWGVARKLVDQVRSGARAWLELGEALATLREQYFAQGGAGRFGSPHRAANRAANRADATDSAAPHESGWQAKVRAELGISDDTARRWMLDSQRYRQMTQIAHGDIVQIDGQTITAAVRDNARAALAEVQTDPTVRPARKWAGLWGAGATKGKQRAAIDHARNLARGLTALETSLPHWADITPEERAALERAWEDIRELLPATFRR